MAHRKPNRFNQTPEERLLVGAIRELLGGPSGDPDDHHRGAAAIYLYMKRKGMDVRDEFESEGEEGSTERSLRGDNIYGLDFLAGVEGELSDYETEGSGGP